MVDDDLQSNTPTALGTRRDENATTLYDVLVGSVAMRDVVQPMEKLENLFVAPPSINLSPVDIEFVGQDDRMTRLRGTLCEGFAATATEEVLFNYIPIDCPPNMSLLPISALTAAREALTPV